MLTLTLALVLAATLGWLLTLQHRLDRLAERHDRLVRETSRVSREARTAATEIRDHVQGANRARQQQLSRIHRRWN